MNSRPPINPYAALLVGVVFLSFAAIFVRASSAPSTVVAAYRMLFAFALLTPWWWWKHRREIFRLTGRQWGLTLLSGVFLALHFGLWFASLSYTSIASSVVLVTLQPLFAFAGAWIFFGERTRPAALVGAAIAVFGGMVLGWGDLAIGGTALFGDFLALMGAAMVTGYWLTGQYLRQSLSLMTYTYVVYGTAGMLLALAAVAMDQPLAPYPATDWLLFLALALFPTLLGHSILNWSIRWVPATTVSVSILGEPVGASILAAIFFAEVPTLWQWVGGALIVYGVYRFLKKREPM
ncbi:DMT family transporter [Desmospora profundinema]|uniref:Drug/metabolite transporter (DMT)-like permease n=1 Tax=Desmospora profundinema TaxID=1571184 RepID=A0ABU1IP64_9BACL|nr:DMT family transporter [Desmospora profundinema]MDR6226580.1 drug/metabolite transporter (DMT)-like permease [Desmospora profundinema]